MKTLHELLLFILLGRTTFGTIFSALSVRVITFVVWVTVNQSLSLNHLLKVLAQSLLHLSQWYVEWWRHVTVVDRVSPIQRRFPRILPTITAALNN